jgi:hypothetical protein
MADIFPPVKQRRHLLELRDALAATEASLRRDDNGDWAISGKRGQIYAAP